VTSPVSTRQPLSSKMPMRCTAAGMAAGMGRPPADAASAPGGTTRLHTITDAKALPVLGAGLRHEMANARPSTTSDGHDDPAGTTARATRPDCATEVGEASE